MKKIIFRYIANDKFLYSKNGVYHKSKNFDEGKGKITFYNTHCTKVQKSVWEREARTGGKSVECMIF